MSQAQLESVDEQPARYQTLAVTLTLGLAFLPMVSDLSSQVSVFFALILVMRVAALRWPAAIPGRLALFLLTLLGIANCLYANYSLVGKVGGSSLLVTMLALKLLELRARRDHRIVAIVIGLLIVVQFLFNQDIGLTLFLGGVAFGVVALLVDLNGGLGPAPLRPVLSVSSRLAVQAIPLTLIMFFLFPRLSTPLWSLGVEQDEAVMGMSESMEPGSISELVVNGDLAFRARFYGATPPPGRLYWRGLVLSQVDDRRWWPGSYPGSSDESPALLFARNPIDYEVLLEPSRQRWIFALDLPTTHPAETRLHSGFQLLSDRPIATTTRFRLRSALDYQTGPTTESERLYTLRLPPNVTARMRGLVKQWSLKATDDWGLVQAGLDFFNQEDFHYTLLPPKLRASPWDEFLFETRSGFCEHYAGSFAVMMRLAGLPSRVVLGYFGGELNHIGGHYMIWQSDAHAWVEVLLRGRGWVRVDPTSAIANFRIDNNSASLLRGATVPTRFQINDRGAFGRSIRQLRDLVDALETTWHGWVLDFSTEQQNHLLERVGLRDFGVYALAAIMMITGTLVMGLIVFAFMRNVDPVDQVSQSYALFCRRLATAGLARRSDEGPHDFASRVIRSRPELSNDVNCITSSYVRCRYRSRPADSDKLGLVRRVRRFRAKAHSAE